MNVTDLEAYRSRAANAPEPGSHRQSADRLLAPHQLNVHDPEMALWLAGTAVNYFADISEYQQPFDDNYAYPIAMFRAHSGYRVDQKAAANWAWCERSLSSGRVRVAFTYVVFVPGQFGSVMTGLKNLFGSAAPTSRLPVVIDMESNSNFAGPGDHSAEANAWAYEIANYTHTPVDLVRSHGYANRPDYAENWPGMDHRIPKHVASYGPQNPGGWAWQYQGGNPAYGAPAGAPRAFAPFGTYVDGNVIYSSLDSIERYLGITAPAPTPEEETMPTIVFDQASPGRVAVIFGGTIKPIADNGETVALENAASAAGVPANTPVVGVPTATFNDYLVRFDTLGQHQAQLAALGALLAELKVSPAIPQNVPSAHDNAVATATELATRLGA